MSGEIVYCDNDEENEAVCHCLDCEQNLCSECDDVFHRSKVRSTHRRVEIHQPTTVPDNESSESGTTQCSSHNQVQSDKIFGGTLEGCMANQKMSHPNLEVPFILPLLIRAIVAKGGLTIEGIFRISIAKGELDYFRDELEAGNQVSFPTPHAAACVLKAWLRELQDPIISHEYYSKAIACAEGTSQGAVQAQVLGVWADLGVLQQRVLMYLAAITQQICLKENSSSNKMTFRTLAVIFAPSLLTNSQQTNQESLENISLEIRFVELLFETLPTKHLKHLFALEKALNGSMPVHTKRPILQELSTNMKMNSEPPPNLKIISPDKGNLGRLQVKVLVVGNSSCGKTSLIRRYVNNCFDEQYVTTIGADYKSKHILWKDGTHVQLQLWDIAGQDRYARMTRPYYQGAEGAIVVCDVSRDVSIDAVNAWKKDLDYNLAGIPVVLVANKCDLLADGAAGMVIGGRLQTLCKDKGFMSWHIISAKKDMNVNEAMGALVKGVLSKKSEEHSKKLHRRQTMSKTGHKGLKLERNQSTRTLRDKADSCVVS